MISNYNKIICYKHFGKVKPFLKELLKQHPVSTEFSLNLLTEFAELKIKNDVCCI